MLSVVDKFNLKHRHWMLLSFLKCRKKNKLILILLFNQITIRGLAICWCAQIQSVKTTSRLCKWNFFTIVPQPDCKYQLNFKTDARKIDTWNYVMNTNIKTARLHSHKLIINCRKTAWVNHTHIVYPSSGVKSICRDACTLMLILMVYFILLTLTGEKSFK